jgi:hypothetical protein
MISRKARIAGASVIIAVNLVVLETAAFLFGEYLFERGNLDVVRPLDTEQFVDGFERMMAVRDDVLGWPPKTQLGRGRFDSTGARRSPAFPRPGNACVSTYGDSFTFGDDVEAAQAWGNRLAQLLGCRVANYGVGGYGTDQALLKYERNTHDEARVVVLGVFPGNLIRNLSQYRGFFTGGINRYGFKPRFILTETGELRYIPIPTLTTDEFRMLGDDPARFLPFETFLPTPWHFPYLWALRNLATLDNLRALWRDEPLWIRYGQPDHPSGALPLMVEIVTAFEEGVRSRGQVPLVVVIPGAPSFAYHRRTGRWAYQPLLDRVEAKGTRVYDLGPQILSGRDEEDFCELFVGQRGGECWGHYNAKGNRLIATLIHGHFERNGYLSDPP